MSSTGELAVLVDAHYIQQRLFRGTLARMTIEGAPRPWLHDVREADWSPDGSTLAVIRDMGTADTIEYPIGTKLCDTSGYLSDLRVSPDGTRVAFMEHPQRWDDRGFVKVVDASGNVTTVAGEFWGEEGLAWTTDGKHLLFAASDRHSLADGSGAGDLWQQVYRAAADGSGTHTVTIHSPNDFTVQDVSDNGRWLVTSDSYSFKVAGHLKGEDTDRNLGWLNRSWAPYLSNDGERVLFTNGNGGPNYTTVWRRTDGSPIVTLGEGQAQGLSPDGRWALSLINATSELVVYPLGAGEPVRLDIAPLTHVERAGWMPDSKSVVIHGTGPSGDVGVFRQSTEGGPPQRMLPGGVTRALVSPDGTAALGMSSGATWAVYPRAGGEPRPISGITAEDTVFAWSSDSRAVFVRPNQDVPARIERLDLTAGARAFFREVVPPVRSGVLRVSMEQETLAADGSQYAYYYVTRPSTLLVVTGAGR